MERSDEAQGAARLVARKPRVTDLTRPAFEGQNIMECSDEAQGAARLVARKPRVTDVTRPAFEGQNKRGHP